MNDNYSKAFSIICELFGVEKLKDYQEKAIKALQSNQDSFICQPTGSGKSIIFQALPFYNHVINLLDSHNHNMLKDIDTLKRSCPYKVIVISPLNSLMNDQKIKLTRKGFKVCCITSVEGSDEQYQNALKQMQDCNIIFTSPESILSNYRQLFHEQTLQDNIAAFAVDESHCVRSWGSASRKSTAFRENYAQLSELRSLTYCPVPMIALTATASKETKNFIMDNLCMLNPLIISSTPERQNIKFVKIDLKERDIEGFFQPIVDKIEKDSHNIEKYLIFCRVMRDVREIYGFFHRQLKNRYLDYETRPYAMFHSKTEEKLKEHILENFSKKDGVIRVLVSTIAFGMGVDCQELYNIVHFGPPATLEDYFQEAGRAGRDGSESVALLAKYPKCLSSKHINSGVKNYCKNDKICRREIIFREFGDNYEKFAIEHLCCDICASKCKCGNCPLISKWWIQDNEINIHQSRHPGENLSKAHKKYLQNGILKIRRSISSFNGYCGKNILSGCPLESIREIIAIASPNITAEDLRNYTCIFNEHIYEDIINLVKESFQLEEYMIISEQSDFCSSASEIEEESGSSDLDSDSSINFHVNLGDSDIDF